MMNNTNTMNTKNYAVVANNGLSILMNQEGQYKVYTAENNLLASLKALQGILNQIPTNEEIAPEVTKVIIGSKSSIKGFVTGSHLQYIRTGANAQGKAFSEEELKMIRTVATMLSNRSLNVWLTTDQWIGKNSAEYRLYNNAWTAQKNELKSQSNKEQPHRAQDAAALMAQIEMLKKQLEEAQKEEVVVSEEVAVDPDDLLE